MQKNNKQMSNIELLNNIIKQSDNIVFFGGAGVSTESGIPDFRSQDGLYNTKYKNPPEMILSHSFFVRNPEEFFKFYRDKMIYTDAKPNMAHIKLAELEKMGKLKAVITQNIDGLHQLAESKNVLELHGSIHRNHCIYCRKSYTLQYIIDSEDVPLCECGGIVKPDVVLYEESLNEDVLEKSVKYISNAEVLIIGGTSLNVYPAANLLFFYEGDKLILINKTVTSMDNVANLIIHDKIGKVFNDIDLSL